MGRKSDICCGIETLGTGITIAGNQLDGTVLERKMLLMITAITTSIARI
jgi:hypothetical protein